jgi:hypothetical protein
VDDKQHAGSGSSAVLLLVRRERLVEGGPHGRVRAPAAMTEVSVESELDTSRLR